MKNISMKMERYNKKGNKWVLIEATEKDINKEYYLNIINSVKFFRNLGGIERLTKGYTYVGYVPVELNSISPDKMEKVVRSFSFNKDSEPIYYDQKKKQYK